MSHPVRWVIWRGLTERTELPGTGMTVVNKSHKFRGVRRGMAAVVPRSYRNYGYG